MSIQRLPQHLVNKLKAGEIVERPASILKELIENSLDAEAEHIQVEVRKWGKELLRVHDDGLGVSREDLPLTIERYATSKITDEQDLETIKSYGFRGEALASIAEVSTFRLQTRTQEMVAGVGYELYKSGDQQEIQQVAYAKSQGSTVHIEDLFHAIPARHKYLKRASTERNHIKKVFMQYALVQYDKHWTLHKDGNVVFQLAPVESLLERAQQLFKADWTPHFKELTYQDEQLYLYGLVGDAHLHFPSSAYLYVYVNGRPVEDRLIKKAIMDAYRRQIVPGTYPFACVFVEIEPRLLDVNIHPRKSEVKFLDPGSMFTRIKESIQSLLWEKKVNYAAFHQQPIRRWAMSSQQIEQLKQVGETRRFASADGRWAWLTFDSQSSVISRSVETVGDVSVDGQTVQVVGQLWQTYILLEGEEGVYRVDQHALAERITFEKMRQQVQDQGFRSEVLLAPITVSYPSDVEVQSVIRQLQQVGFDLSEFGNQKVIVHAVPEVFVTYKIDLELLFNQVWHMEEVNFDLLLDEVLGMKACKASIKAGQKLSHLEMRQLIEDGVQMLPGMFVCQHGRPSVVKIEKSKIDQMFDRS